jgi:dTDP-4-amino-4,6-dideoxygalactose transaminase
MAAVVPVPQSDPGAGYRAQKSDIDAAVTKVLAGGWYILGREVAEFEVEFASFVGVGHGVGVANGTDALVLAMRALGIGAGDKVATVSHTAVATVAAIELAGATPILLDVDAATYAMDVEDLAATLELEQPVKAVIPVHLYGHPADMPRIVEVADRYGAAVIEDCSQAHGAAHGNRSVGRFGRVACFSLYPTKNLGALGDGGIVVTDDVDVARNLRELREYGWRERYISAVPGMNTRLDEMQAAILRVKLRRLAADNDRRRAIAASYDRGLAGLAVDLPAVGGGAQHVYHQYVIRSPKRDGLRQRLRDRSIGTNIHYPAPVHLQPAYRGRVSLGVSRCAATEAILPQVLSLPMFPQLTDEQVERVVREIRDAVADGGR